MTINSTTPIPNAIPPSGVSATPTVYTLHIASLAGEAYGLAASSTSSSGVGLGQVASGVVGVLGGSAGTTRDTFELLYRAERHGARVALFGRKIQRAESQLDLVSLMRPVLRGELSPADAVRAYHDALAKAEITPQRRLEADLEVTDPVLRSE